MRVERHDPVHGHEEDRDGVDQQPAAAQPLHLARDARIGRAVLLEPPAVQHVRDGVPHEEIHHRANDEERHIEVRFLLEQDGVRLNRFGSSPQEDRTEPEQDRNKRQRHQPERAGSSLEDTPAGESPFTARHVLKHQQSERAQR